jgi:hypothetical protein
LWSVKHAMSRLLLAFGPSECRPLGPWVVGLVTTRLGLLDHYMDEGENFYEVEGCCVSSRHASNLLTKPRPLRLLGQLRGEFFSGGSLKARTTVKKKLGIPKIRGTVHYHRCISELLLQGVPLVSKLRTGSARKAPVIHRASSAVGSGETHRSAITLSNRHSSASRRCHCAPQQAIKRAGRTRRRPRWSLRP